MITAGSSPLLLSPSEGLLSLREPEVSSLPGPVLPPQVEMEVGLAHQHPAHRDLPVTESSSRYSVPDLEPQAQMHGLQPQLEGLQHPG
jgi:hypothetical protein